MRTTQLENATYKAWWSLSNCNEMTFLSSSFSALHLYYGIHFEVTCLVSQKLYKGKWGLVFFQLLRAGEVLRNIISNKPGKYIVWEVIIMWFIFCSAWSVKFQAGQKLFKIAFSFWWSKRIIFVETMLDYREKRIIFNAFKSSCARCF